MAKQIIVEGVDKCGKSTVVEGLFRSFNNANYFKNEIKPEDKELVTIGKIAGIYFGVYQFSKYLKEKTIFDRAHLTEIVYSERRGYSSLNHIDWLSFEQQYLTEAVVIYLQAPVEVIKQRFITDNETYVDADEVETLLAGYEDYLSITNLPVLRLSSLDNETENLQKAIKFINEN